jgi:hypothetical protein
MHHPELAAESLNRKRAADASSLPISVEPLAAWWRRCLAGPSQPEGDHDNYADRERSE